MSGEIERYRDSWGGKTENGEEMWWSGVWPELLSGGERGRARFAFDPRHQILLSFFERALAAAGPCAKVADFGCGTGGGTLNFSLYLNRPITGYDIFPTQIRIAQAQNEKAKARCEFALLDAEGKFPVPDGSLDIIFSSDVLGHVPDIHHTVADWSRALRSGGHVVLFTEASYSPADRSVMARLYRAGIDMIGSVPEHISLWTREALEAEFASAGLVVEDRYSASVLHFPLSPKEYLAALKANPDKRVPFWIKPAAHLLHFLQKLTPFYPRPQQWLRSWLIRAYGREAYGCNYFYLLRKR